MDDCDFMRIALAAAKEAAAAGEVPIGAVAVRDGEVVAVARNRVEELGSVAAHAEFELLHQVEKLTGDWRMSDFDFYITKEPCPMCAGMLVNSRVRRIIFGLNDPATGGCGGALDVPGLPGALWHPEVTGGVMEEDAKELIQQFFRERRQKQVKN